MTMPCKIQGDTTTANQQVDRMNRKPLEHGKECDALYREVALTDRAGELISSRTRTSLPIFCLRQQNDR